MQGFDFHRQKPIGNHIVDFFCEGLMLAIEIDGISHENKYFCDIERQKEIEKIGINFLRFQDKDIKDNMEGVLMIIEDWIKENHIE